MNKTAVAMLPKRNNLIAKFADRFSVDEGEVMKILKATAFKQRENSPPVTDEQMMALMIVADQYGLNPFVKEIYAYPDKSNGIVPVVGVDGWSRIMNDHPQMDGIEFRYSEEMVAHKGKNCHVWIEAIITRKDRSKPIVVREYFDEVVRNVSYQTPWDSHPKRMHRHKAEIQGARIAFGFGGIYDEDEAQRIIEKDITEETTIVGSDKPGREIVYYTNDEFEAKKSAWKATVQDGKKTGAELIVFVESKGKLFTEAQRAEISAWKKTATVDAAAADEPVTVEVEQADNDFVADMEAHEPGAQG